jgi:hypothetical protein
MFGNDSANYGAVARNNPHGKVKVLAFTAMKTGNFDKQYHRPYEINLNGNTAAQLNHRVGNSLDKFATINSHTFAGISSNILHPSPIPMGVAGIVNGWDTSRYYFYMLIEIDSGFTSQREIVLGYTDEVGVSQGGHTNPNMRLYVNSVSRVATMNANTPAFGGVQGGVAPVSNRFIEASHVLANSDHVSMYNPQSLFSMRTTDMYGTIHAKAINDYMPATNAGSIITTDAMKASRAESNPNNYLTSIVSAYYQADAKTNGFGNNGTSTLSEAATATAPLHMLEDPFLSCIMTNDGFGTVNNFTWSELVRLDPSLEHTAVFSDPSQVVPMNQIGNSGSSGVNAQISSIISSSITSMMMQTGISELSFYATNMTIDGSRQLQFDPTGCKPFVQSQQIAQQLDFLRQRIITEVLDDVSRTNEIPYQVQVTIRLAGRSEIKLAFNDPEFETFIVPTFSDAMFSPVVATSGDQLQSLASGFQSIFQDILPNSKVPASMFQTKHQLHAELDESQPYNHMGGAGNVLQVNTGIHSL